MLGALTLTLTGTASVAAAAAVIVYRVAGCWTVGAAGTRSGSRPRPPLPGRPGAGRVPPAGRAAAVTVSGSPAAP